MYYDFYYGYSQRIVYTYEHFSTNDLYWEMVLFVKDYRNIKSLKRTIEQTQSYIDSTEGYGEYVGNATIMIARADEQINKIKERLKFKILRKIN